MGSVDVFQTMDVYKLRPRLLRFRVLVASRFQFQLIRVVYQAAEDKPNGSSVESGQWVPWFDVCLRCCTMDQIKQGLTKIQSLRLQNYVHLHYIT